jgi:hypothetical protein
MRFNRLFFWLFYRLGKPPWEGHPLPERLLELIEGVVSRQVVEVPRTIREL